MSSKSGPDSQAFPRELDKKLWIAADRLRSNLDAAVYMHAVLDLIFLKYVSDSFAQRQAEIEAMIKDPDSDFHLPPGTEITVKNGKTTTYKITFTGKLIDDASEGSAAADLFLQDPGLRAAVRKSLNTAGKAGYAALIPTERLVRNEFEVVYAGLVRQGLGAWPPALPFFSAINLMHHASRVQILGFRESIRRTNYFQSI